MGEFHGRFVWYELMTTDMAAAMAFYATVLGWDAREAAMPGMAYTLFTAGEAAVGAVMTLPEEARKTGMPPRWTGYVGVDDVDAATDRVKSLGGAVHVAPADIPNIGRFSIVADPQMATLALIKWLDQAQPAKPNDAVGWHELLAADWDKAFAFYGALFGWEKGHADITPMGTYQVFAAAGHSIGGMFTKPAMVPVPFWLFYFNVADIDAAAARVTAGGGKILEGPIEVPGGSRVARCTDPQGAMFAMTARSDKAVGYFERAPPAP